MKDTKTNCTAATAVIIILLTVIAILSTSLVVTKHKLSEVTEFSQCQDSLILSFYRYYDITRDDVITDAEIMAVEEIENRWLDY